MCHVVHEWNAIPFRKIKEDRYGENHEWKFIPFEIVLSEFQIVMDKLFCSFSQFHIVYRDDVLEF